MESLHPVTKSDDTRRPTPQQNNAARALTYAYACENTHKRSLLSHYGDQKKSLFNTAGGHLPQLPIPSATDEG